MNGTGLPDVDFDIGESYAGLLSITDDLSAAEKLYFWFFPSENEKADKEILLWLNGGVSASGSQLERCCVAYSLHSPAAHLSRVSSKSTALLSGSTERTSQCPTRGLGTG